MESHLFDGLRVPPRCGISTTDTTVLPASPTFTFLFGIADLGMGPDGNGVNQFPGTYRVGVLSFSRTLKYPGLVVEGRARTGMTVHASCGRVGSSNESSMGLYSDMVNTEKAQNALGASVTA
jgi:hypothetical protein